VNDPQRLLFDPGATLSELQLLESWQLERPSVAARASTLAVLGLSGAGGAAASSHVTSALKSSSIAPKASTLWTLTVTKWLALGAIGVGVAVAGALYLGQGSSAPVLEPQTQKPMALEPVRQESSALVAVPTATTTPTTMTNAVPEAREAPTEKLPPAKSLRAPRIEPRSAEGTMAQEIAKLDQARVALTEGDAARTQQLVNEYEARFPEGSFLEEAEVLRIEALLQQGDRAGATGVGTRFLGSHPASPHAGRVRTLLGSPP
jgi:hypothetical protein